MVDRPSFIIDTDTASDDAVAIILAAKEPSVDIAAVTIVAGNVPIDLAIRNAIVTLDVAGAADVPVYVGHDTPMTRTLETAQNVHGADGMSEAPLPEPSRAPDAEHAVDALLRLANEEPGKHTLVTIGPMTNIAHALGRDELLLTKFRHTFMMAGSPDGVGNVNTAGEFNVWADPEAATIVLAADGAKTMVGWNVSRLFTVIRPDEHERFLSMGPIGEFMASINVAVDTYCREFSGLDGYDLPDPIAMAVAIDETLITESTNEWMVVGLDEPTRGAVLLDRRANAPAANCRVLWAVDEKRFKERLFAACQI